MVYAHDEPALWPRIGHGYDAHALASDRDLVLCGVRIPWDMGLAGHSDADVATHALMDALLGALGKGDIGAMFPDSDPGLAGISSLLLLEQVISHIHNAGLRLGNADLTIVCQAPRLSPHIPIMRENLARICQVERSAVNVKATTTEYMGFPGRGEGIAAHAVALLIHRKKRTGKSGQGCKSSARPA
jgi:2-C-methyl-D-erythritol 2,4-cyclodiphosphate synthase